MIADPDSCAVWPGNRKCAPYREGRRPSHANSQVKVYSQPLASFVKRWLDPSKQPTLCVPVRIEVRRGRASDGLGIGKTMSYRRAVKKPGLPKNAELLERWFIS